VGEDVLRHFRLQEYEVEGQRTMLGGWSISLRKGNTFQSILGMRSALKVEIYTSEANTVAKAGVGIFGQQAIPTAISMLLFWPVLVPQIWGLIKQSRLDDEALAVIAESLQRHAQVVAAPSTAVVAEARPAFCPECGKPFAGAPKFCPECGAKLSEVF
jgi:hypothetical protein